MLTVHLMGGLGNQLFQIFTLISLSMEQKQSFVIPQFKPDENRKIYKRPTYWNTILKFLVPYVVKEEKRFPVYTEREFHYRELPFFKNNNVKLYGYFQSHKYFEKYENEILNLLQYDSLQKNIKLQYENYFLFENENKNQNKVDLKIISIHFRIGDYKENQHAHVVLPLHYYTNSLREALKDNKNIKRVLCFGEKSDMRILYENIQKLQTTFPQIEFIFCDFDIEDWKQLVLMSSCHHHIIANSSFSWWGAYFNRSTQKNVYYPNKWFGPALASKNTRDLFPSSWKKIDV